VPVALRNLQLDAYLWSSFSLTPYEPYCTRWKYALLDTPRVEFDMKIGSPSVPVTGVPLLRSLFFRVIANEIPRDFRFPKYNTVHFVPPELRKKKEEFLRMDVEEVSKLSGEDMKDYFPENWHLYESLDLDDDGKMTREELVAVLPDWGYSPHDAGRYFDALDVKREGAVSFPQFCWMWPNVTAAMVPDEYEGVLFVKVRGVKDLPKPFLGSSDHTLFLRLGNETANITQIFEDGDDVESFEFDCLSPLRQELEVSIREKGAGIPLLNPGHKEIASASVDLTSIASVSTMKHVEVDLEPEGTLLIDLSYGKFADRWNLTSGAEGHDDHDDDDADGDVEDSFLKRVFQTDYGAQ